MINRHIGVHLKPIPFVVISAFLRLGTKYEIEVLRSEAIDRLAHEYPFTLEDYDRQSINSNTIDGGHCGCATRGSGLSGVVGLVSIA